MRGWPVYRDRDQPALCEDSFDCREYLTEIEERCPQSAGRSRTLFHICKPNLPPLRDGDTTSPMFLFRLRRISLTRQIEWLIWPKVIGEEDSQLKPAPNYEPAFLTARAN